ncbi:hypothetical protein HYU92_02525 [Candidatus Curtissbacteria bacterium]|nr:hypothetical protein [Candidatus Curtissbacteria bacterium]
MTTKPVTAYTGRPAPKSGQYKPSGASNEITLSKGDITPPNRFGVRQRFTLVDPTKTKR